jgi:predicted ester cyclase
MSASDNEALVRRAIETIWNQGDLDAADELFAADYINHDGLIADLVLGPEAIKISAALHRLAFPGLRIEVDELIAAEDIVVLRWSARRGSTDRPDGSAIASNQKSLTGITRSRLARGKIIESWTQWDRTGVLRELEAVPMSSRVVRLQS